ncbi:hypothetical protein [Rheinheimera sp. EpRS3]|jgi:hypothetical protein|nr:hypothetical protein [Rheinheimera sp. EpRS3]
MADNKSEQVVQTWPKWMQNYRLTPNSPKKEATELPQSNKTGKLATTE